MTTLTSLDPQIGAIKSYEFGQSRKPLDRVAKIVLDAVGTPRQQAVAYQLAGLLNSDATLECKRFACRQLAVIGTESQLDDLAPFLRDDDLSDMARYALQPIESDAVDRALLDALDKTDSDSIAIGIATTLGARGTERAVSPLKKLAASGKENVARAAIAALGRVGTKGAARALASVKGQVPHGLRNDVSEAQLRIAATLLAAGDADRAEAIYEELVAAEEPDAVRKAAFLGLVKSGGIEDPEAWRARLDNDPMLREAAAGYLHKVADRYETLAEQQTAR